MQKWKTIIAIRNVQCFLSVEEQLYQSDVLWHNQYGGWDDVSFWLIRKKISVFSSYWFFSELKLLNIKHTGTKTFFSLRLSAQTLLLMLMHRKVWNRYLINYFKYKLGTLIILISIIDSFYPARFIDFYFSTHSYLLRGFSFSVDCAASTLMIVQK